MRNRSLGGGRSRPEMLKAFLVNSMANFTHLVTNTHSLIPNKVAPFPVVVSTVANATTQLPRYLDHANSCIVRNSLLYDYGVLFVHLLCSYCIYMQPPHLHMQPLHLHCDCCTYNCGIFWVESLFLV